MTETKPLLCKDCLAEDPTGAQAKRRKATRPGPRCMTHRREHRRAQRIAAHGRRLVVGFSITREIYDRLKAYQGGRCAICRRAKGIQRNLAVDHDHACCIGPTSCGKCVRGLLCSGCNDILAFARDDPAFFERAADYLRDWPSRGAGITTGKVGIRRV